MKRFAGCIGLAIVVLGTAGGAQDAPLAFAGFSREMDLASLLDRYPQSSHDVTPTNGVRRPASQNDLNSWMRQFFRNPEASGRYELRLTRSESHDHLYYVQADVRGGKTDRLWLLLEISSDLLTPREQARGMEARYPACASVLDPLTAKHGHPQRLAPRQEEAVESTDYLWIRQREAMKLQCGRYEGRKSVFAIGLTLEPAASP
jgi:hypothetical protein